MSVKVTRDGVAALKRALTRLAERQVLVGIPSSTAGREIDPEHPQPVTNAALGYIHEKGSPAANIPARPWLGPGIMDARDEIVRRYKTGAQAVLDGRLADPDKVHQVVGQIAADAARKRITDGDFTPLAPATIAKRKARGRESKKPLTDTGQMRNAVSFVTRKRNR